MTASVLDRILESLRAAANISRTYQARPAAVLWTDHDGQWRGVAARLRGLLPELLTLGDFAPEERRGPAIWIKCMLARTLDEADWPAGAVPIIYLPGVSRADLRAIETCPRELQPLAELQYRGLFWSQLNGRDWTVNAFLASSRGGLALDVAADQATQRALLRALDLLLDTPLEDLRGRRLEATDFDALLSTDPVRDLLTWMNDPEGSVAAWQGARWDAFRSRCQADWKLDPEADGVLVAAERISAGRPEWALVWERYRVGWRAFPQVIERLKLASPPPPRDLFTDLSRYPRVNAEAEDRLRSGLAALVGLEASEAASKLMALEQAHGPRRQWLWAEMGQAPLALALEPLTRLAALAARPFGGLRLEDMAGAYRDEFWRVDAAAREALAQVRTQADTQALSAALGALYVPWLDEANRRFQDLVRQDGYPGARVVKEPNGAYQGGGECWLFVDGLRYDVAQDLAALLKNQGLEVSVASAWATVPSVTASGKVACSPVAHLAQGRDADQDFVPSHGTLDKPLNTAVLRKALKDAGWQVLGGGEPGDPAGRGWMETGDLDHYGHEHGLRLAREVPVILDALVEQVRVLIDAGWQRIRIVTDHGWLLVPGGLPKTELAKFLTATRWGRCAALTATAQPTELTLTWSWSPAVRIATAPGIASFIAGKVYDHGGLSLQESLIPVVTVTRPAGIADQVVVAVEEIRWTGLRCRVTVAGAGAGYTADLRQKANDPRTSQAGGGKPLKDGKASLVIEDDTLEGEAISLVILNEMGQAVARVATVIGGA